MQWLYWEIISQLGSLSERDPSTSEFRRQGSKLRGSWMASHSGPIAVCQKFKQLQIPFLSTAAAMEPTLFMGENSAGQACTDSHTNNPSLDTILASCSLPLNSRSSISVQPFPLWTICLQKSFNSRRPSYKDFAEEVWHQPHWGWLVEAVSSSNLSKPHYLFYKRL